jgi:hypothetical protein
MKWRVWITGYPGSYSTVEAESSIEAMKLGAVEQRGAHHGEIVEINARPDWDRIRLVYSKSVRIVAPGKVTFL